MTHTAIKLPMKVPLKLLLLQLNSPKHRPLWDSNVKTMEILSGYEYDSHYLYRTMSLALYKADFVDKKIVGTLENNIIIISYGVDEKKPQVSGFTRGLTTLSIQKIEIEDNTIVLHDYSQTDARSPIAKAFAGLGPGRQFDWGKALINRLKSITTT